MTSAFCLSSLSALATTLRVLCMDAVEHAGSGHPGMPMGMADVVTVLYSHFLKFQSSYPLWPDRDRFILSAGHGSILLYNLNYLTGYKEMSLNDLKNFRKWGGPTAGHPEYNPTLGIETTTGPLGQGLANAVGMAIAEQHLQAQFGHELVDHRTYVIAGDGCLMEGISHEAISLAGHLKLSKLVVLFDDNHISIDGETALAVTDDQILRFKACGWQTHQIDGHNFQEISDALTQAQNSNQPTLIACKTVIGKGAPTKAGTSAVHGSPLGIVERQKVCEALNWPYPAFHIPENILEKWRKIGQTHSLKAQEWQKRHQISSLCESFDQAMKGTLNPYSIQSLNDYKKKIIKEMPICATRISSGQTLEQIADHLPQLFGGSADLTSSTNAKTKSMQAFTAGNRAGQFLHYGVREHAMAAIMNGIAAHKGLIPYGSTFLVFSDYCRPAIRLSALMNLHVIYVLTHDSIGLGEDGPTHQPVEHLAALRAIPNLNVFRPCDGIEVIECWEFALKHKGPSVLVLSRQDLVTLRNNSDFENKSSRGGYILKESYTESQVTLLATGSEVNLMIKAQILLEDHKISATVVSMPCLELFDQQDSLYQQKVLGKDTFRIVCEAAVNQGWHKYIGVKGGFIGMKSFGASGSAKNLYEHFEITPEAVVSLTLNLLKNNKI